MTPRERWVVYPLLFFALSLALKPKLLQEIDTKRVRCQSLTIAEGDQPFIEIGQLTRPGPGRLMQVEGRGIRILGEDRERALELRTTADGKAGIVRTYAEGAPQITLDTGPYGTFVQLHQVRRTSNLGLIFGQDDAGQRIPLASVGPVGEAGAKFNPILTPLKPPAKPPGEK